MKSTYASNISADKDETGGMIKMEWICPYCNFYNPDLIFSSDLSQLTSDFEVDRDCEYCRKKVTVVCHNVSYLGLQI